MSVNPDKIVRLLNKMLEIDGVGVSRMLRAKFDVRPHLGNIDGVVVTIDDAGAHTTMLDVLGGLCPNHEIAPIVASGDTKILALSVVRDATGKGRK